MVVGFAGLGGTGGAVQILVSEFQYLGNTRLTIGVSVPLLAGVVDGHAVGSA